MDEQLDPEMLKNLDFLLDMEVIEGEAEWAMVEEMEVVENGADQDGEE